MGSSRYPLPYTALLRRTDSLVHTMGSQEESPAGCTLAAVTSCVSGLAWRVPAVLRGMKSQHTHDCGWKIAPPTIQTSGLAFSGLCQQHEWLRECSFPVVRCSMDDPAETHRAFFRSREGFPKCKIRFQVPVFTILQDMRVTKEELPTPKSGRLRPDRGGNNPFANSEASKRIGKRWNGTIYRKVSLAVQEEGDSSTGVDCSVSQIAGCDKIHRQPTGFRLFKTGNKRHRHLFSPKGKRNNWRRKEVAPMQRAGRWQAQARNAWRNRVSQRVASKAHTVVRDDPDLAGMTRRAAETVESPGTNARTMAGRNREARSTCHGAIRSMQEHGAGDCVVVKPAHAARTCIEFDILDADTRRSPETRRHVACGHARSADINGARDALASAAGKAVQRRASGLPAPAARKMDPPGVNPCL